MMSSTNPSDRRRVIITGGRGRLARVVREPLIAAGYEVTCCSREGGAGFEPLASLLEPGAFARAHAVLHLAWSTVPFTAEQNPGREWSEDLPLLDALLRNLQAGRERPHFVFFSSGGAVYGDAGAHASREADPCRPLGSYGRAKLAAEELITQSTRQHGLAATILRISNPYGFPGQDDKPQGLIPKLLRSARNGGEVSVWGDGSARKDFLFHSDFSDALRRVLQQRVVGLYNLSAGTSHTVSEVIGTVEGITGRRLRLRHEPAFPWDVHDSRVDSGKLQAATGWQPVVSLEEGIRLMEAGES